MIRVKVATCSGQVGGRLRIMSAPGRRLRLFFVTNLFVSARQNRKRVESPNDFCMHTNDIRLKYLSRFSKTTSYVLMNYNHDFRVFATLFIFFSRC